MRCEANTSIVMVFIVVDWVVSHEECVTEQPEFTRVHHKSQEARLLNLNYVVFMSYFEKFSVDYKVDIAVFGLFSAVDLEHTVRVNIFLSKYESIHEIVSVWSGYVDQAGACVKNGGHWVDSHLRCIANFRHSGLIRWLVNDSFNEGVPEEGVGLGHGEPDDLWYITISYLAEIICPQITEGLLVEVCDIKRDLFTGDQTCVLHFLDK